jgi:PPOX class probable F420-dependent enzyme
LMRLSREERHFMGIQRVARIATVDPNGTPHVVPVCFALEENTLYVASDYGSRKIRNLRANEKISVIVDEYEEDWKKLKGVYLTGVAEIVEPGPEFSKARSLLKEKYPQYTSLPIKEGETAIIKILPRKAVSWGLAKQHG